MSTKHTATLPDGKTVTRTSANRTYTALVAVGPESREHAAERMRRDIAHQAGQNAKYAAVVTFIEEGGQLVSKHLGYGVTKLYLPGETDRNASVYVPRGEGTDEERALAAYREFVANGQEHSAALQAGLEEILAGPALVGSWFVAGWSGTPALAAKAARQQDGRGREVRVLTEITTVVK